MPYPNSLRLSRDPIWSSLQSVATWAQPGPNFDVCMNVPGRVVRSHENEWHYKLSNWSCGVSIRLTSFEANNVFLHFLTVKLSLTKIFWLFTVLAHCWFKSGALRFYSYKANSYVVHSQIAYRMQYCQDDRSSRMIRFFIRFYGRLWWHSNTCLVKTVFQHCQIARWESICMRTTSFPQWTLAGVQVVFVMLFALDLLAWLLLR